jgi:hypothetical protein
LRAQKAKPSLSLIFSRQAVFNKNIIFRVIATGYLFSGSQQSPALKISHWFALDILCYTFYYSLRLAATQFLDSLDIGGP